MWPGCGRNRGRGGPCLFWWRRLATGWLLGAVLAEGNLLLTVLAGRVDSSYLFPLVQGSIIVGVALCSALLFREKLSPRGWLGIALGVAAIVTIQL